MDRQPILKTLDAQAKFFIWDLDTTMIFFVGFGFGVITHELTVGCVLGLGLTILWKRLKKGRQRGFALHWLYWHTPIRIFRTLPASARRNFLG